MKRKLCLVLCLVCILGFNVFASAAVTSWGGNISATQSWKSLGGGMVKSSTNSTFKIKNYSNRGVYLYTAFRVYGTLGQDASQTLLFGSGTSGRVAKDSVLYTKTMSNVVNNGKAMELKYKIPAIDGYTAASDAATIEIYY